MADPDKVAHLVELYLMATVNQDQLSVAERKQLYIAWFALLKFERDMKEFQNGPTQI